jgi:hypothetical protein
MPGSHLRFVRMRFKIKISQVHVPPVIFNVQGLERRTTPVLHRGGRHLTLLLGVVEESQDPARVPDVASTGEASTSVINESFRLVLRQGGTWMVFTNCGYVQLEQRRNRRVDPTKGVVVHDRAHQTSVFGQRPGLRLDGLSCQDAADRRQERVAVQEVHITRKLLDGFEAGNPLDLYSPVPSVCQTLFCSVNLSTTFDLHRYVRPRGISTQQVDGADWSGVFSAYEGKTGGQRLGMFGKKCL